MKNFQLKKRLLSLGMVLSFLLGGPLASAQAPLPFLGELQFSEPAREIFKKQRNFVDTYVWDKSEEENGGGFYFWVRGNGEIEDKKRFTLFQANVILWAGGLHSQHPDDKNLEIIEGAADYLIDHLYKGNGHWFERYDPDLEEKVDFFWNPRSEVFIAYALFEAHKHTGKFIYKKIARETTERQRKDFPDGRIFAEFSPDLDVGFRFPERMGHYLAADLYEDKSSLDYAHQFDELYRDIYSIERGTTPQGEAFEFRHGMAIIDQMLFAYLEDDQDAYDEAVLNYTKYKTQGHQDHKTFKNDVPGEVADNGRDYYDKRLSMALLQWSKTGDVKFRDEALQMWKEVLRFWDSAEPYGFYVNTSQDRKTCFSINQPAQFIDLTAPEIVKIYDKQTAFWNHQLTVIVKDPNYFWNDHELVGIGVDPRSLALDVPNGFQYGNIFVESSECEDCYEVTTNFLTLNDVRANVTVADYFANDNVVEIESEASIAIAKWGGLNYWSYIYYLTLLLVVFMIITFVRKVVIKDKDEGNATPAPGDSKIDKMIAEAKDDEEKIKQAKKKKTRAKKKKK